jgi:hypothetical protein
MLQTPSCHSAGGPVRAHFLRESLQPSTQPPTSPRSLLRLVGGGFDGVTTEDRTSWEEGSHRQGEDDESVEVIALSGSDGGADGSTAQSCRAVEFDQPSADGSLQELETGTRRELPEADSKKPGFVSAEECRRTLRMILDRPGLRLQACLWPCGIRLAMSPDLDCRCTSDPYVAFHVSTPCWLASDPCSYYTTNYMAPQKECPATLAAARGNWT